MKSKNIDLTFFILLDDIRRELLWSKVINYWLLDFRWSCIFYQFFWWRATI